MEKQAIFDECITIPTISREAPLRIQFFSAAIIGLDKVLDYESQLYLRLLFRLVDKSFDEYCLAKEYLEDEIRTSDKLKYRLLIVNNLENCLSSINRAIKIVDVLINGLAIKENGEKKIKKMNYNLLDFVKQETVNKINEYRVSNVRNRVEHLNEDIYLQEFRTGLSLDVDAKYKNICINNRCLSLSMLALIIQSYHNFVLEIFNNFPTRVHDDVYYYDKVK